MVVSTFRFTDELRVYKFAPRENLDGIHVNHQIMAAQHV